MKKKYIKDSTLAEILKHSQSKEILRKHNVPCITCPFAKLEMNKLTIRQIAEMYNVNLENLLKELNK